MSPKVLLVPAVIAAVVVYVTGDVLSAWLYDGYRYADQAISELSAFGSPVRPLMVTTILVHNVLLLAFGIGVLLASRRRIVWWIGALQIADLVLVGIATHTFWAMSSRGTPAGFNDAMHIASSVVFSLLVLAMMLLSAVAFPGWFRAYALATAAVVTGFGIASSLAMRGLDRNDTPWAGGFERISAGAYFAWLVLLAVRVARREPLVRRFRGTSALPAGSSSTGGQGPPGRGPSAPENGG